MPDCEKEMGARAGRIEWWCNPLDGSIRVVVGMGKRKWKCKCKRKSEAEAALSFCLAIQNWPAQKRQKRAVEATRVSVHCWQLRACDRALQPRPIDCGSPHSVRHRAVQRSAGSALQIRYVPKSFTPRRHRIPGGMYGPVPPRYPICSFLSNVGQLPRSMVLMHTRQETLSSK